jgi:hypothetical protein
VPSGYQELFRGALSDVFSTSMTSVGRGGVSASGRPTAAIYYASPSDEGGAGLGVATSRGSDALRRASQVLATDTRDVTVRGHDAVVASLYGTEGFLTVSWLEDDGTLVRVEAFGLDEAELLDQLDQLESIGSDAFRALVREHPVDSSGNDGATEETFEETAEPIPASGVLASVQLTEGDVEYSASVREAEDGSLSLELEENGPTGSSGSGVSLVSADVSTSSRLEAANGDLIVAGVLEGPVVDVFLDCGDTGRCDFDASGPSTAVVDDGTSVVFLAVIGSDVGDVDVYAVGTREDGSEVRILL